MKTSLLPARGEEIPCDREQIFMTLRSLLDVSRQSSFGGVGLGIYKGTPPEEIKAGSWWKKKSLSEAFFCWGWHFGGVPSGSYNDGKLQEAGW